MPQSIESRHVDAEVLELHDGSKILGDYIPFRFLELDTTIVHVAGEGDTWFTLAQLYYADISDRAAGLWWILCDFQPQPVVDPTVQIAPGSVVYVPDPATVQAQILPFRREAFV